MAGMTSAVEGASPRPPRLCRPCAAYYMVGLDRRTRSAIFPDATTTERIGQVEKSRRRNRRVPLGGCGPNRLQSGLELASPFSSGSPSSDLYGNDRKSTSG